MNRAINILLVDDNLADVRLAREAFKTVSVKYHLDSVSDGIEAMEYLRKEGAYPEAPEPDIILLDLNLPRKNGYEVLEEIKTDKLLKHIPVIVFSTTKSGAPKAYELLANCYLIKPVDFEEFLELVKLLEAFWLKKVIFPGL